MHMYLNPNTNFNSLSCIYFLWSKLNFSYGKIYSFFSYFQKTNYDFSVLRKGHRSSLLGR